LNAVQSVVSQVLKSIVVIAKPPMPPVKGSSLRRPRVPGGAVPSFGWTVHWAGLVNKKTALNIPSRRLPDGVVDRHRAPRLIDRGRVVVAPEEFSFPLDGIDAFVD